MKNWIGPAFRIFWTNYNNLIKIKIIYIMKKEILRGREKDYD